jgi:hypothetical protein
MINENLNFNQGNIIYEADTSNSFSPKIKLEEIIEAIKNMNPRHILIDELRSAVKILKRFKMTESAKWYF